MLVCKCEFQPGHSRRQAERSSHLCVCFPAWLHVRGAHEPGRVLRTGWGGGSSHPCLTSKGLCCLCRPMRSRARKGASHPPQLFGGQSSVPLSSVPQGRSSLGTEDELRGTPVTEGRRREIAFSLCLTFILPPPFSFPLQPKQQPGQHEGVKLIYSPHRASGVSHCAKL